MILVPFASEDSDFSEDNFPFGIAELPHGPAAVSRIGDWVLDIGALQENRLISGPKSLECDDLTQIGRHRLVAIRAQLQKLLSTTISHPQGAYNLPSSCVHPADSLVMHKPAKIFSYTDFYGGIYHAANVGRMFRPDMPPLLPNYRHIPVGYFGKANSIVVGGTPVKRPSGQIIASTGAEPTFSLTRELDFELELGVILGKGSDIGDTIPMEQAESHFLGYVLINDWSARDIQRWEYQPLGPFLAKSFATGISPWLILPEALQPFLVAGEEQDPMPLPYLRRARLGHHDIELRIELKTAKMMEAEVISRPNAKYLYWTLDQQLTHQASNGSPTEPGDLLASGTISGPEPATYGSLLELTWRGQNPLLLSSGESRTFLENGDEVTFFGRAGRSGHYVGFGPLRNKIIS